MAYTLPTDQTRQERYDQSFDTHISARRGHGHPYPSTQPALDDLTTDWLPPSHPHRYVPLERAVSDLASALRNPNFPGPQNTARALAFARLERTATARRWWPDLVFKAFADLDLLFSRNRLGGNVYLRWATPEVVSALQREGYAVGPGYVKRYGPERGGRSVRERIGIYLNAEALLLHGTLMNVWKVLLHFMVVSPSRGVAHVAVGG